MKRATLICPVYYMEIYWMLYLYSELYRLTLRVIMQSMEIYRNMFWYTIYTLTYVISSNNVSFCVASHSTQPSKIRYTDPKIPINGSRHFTTKIYSLLNYNQLTYMHIHQKPHHFTCLTTVCQISLFTPSSKQDTLNQWRFNVGPASQTVDNY